jgi:hypothetical protein
VERVSRILKGRLRLIMKQSKVSLRNMSNIVETCIVLYDFYIINNEGIEDELIIEAKI